MSDIHWIKLKTEMFADEKIRLIESMPEADAILVIWIKLLAQAGRTNANGYIFLNENVPFTDEMLSTLFNRPLNTIRLAIKTLTDFGMIEVDENNFIQISNWSRHQNIEGMEKVKEQNRLRQQKYRNKQKQIETGTQSESNTESDSNVTLHNVQVTEQTQSKKENKNQKKNETQTKEETSEGRLEEMFNEFIEKYPVKKSKKKAKEIFFTIKPNEETFKEIINGIEKLKKFDSDWNNSFIPNPVKFLEGERWKDQIKINIEDLTYEDVLERTKFCTAEERQKALQNWRKKYDKLTDFTK